MLATSGFFDGLAPIEVDALAARCRYLEFGPRATLFERGETAREMYFVAVGALEVRLDGATIDHLGVGAVVGEMALLTAPVRNATVVVGDDGAGVWALSHEDFEAAVADRPGLLERVLLQVRPRLERAELAPLLADWFGAVGNEEIERLQSRLTWRHLSRGEVVYGPGDAAPDVYLVISGRIAERDAAGKTLRVAGRGSVVGAEAVLDARTRSGGAVSAGESHVAAIPAAVASESGHFVKRLAADALARLRTAGVEHPAAATVLFAAATPGAPVEPLVAEVAARAAAWGSTVVLTSSEVDRRFGRAGTAQAVDAAAGGAEVASLAAPLELWLDQQVRSHEYVFLVADDTATQWTLRCLRLVDEVMVVAAAGVGTGAAAASGAPAATVADPRPGPLETSLVEGAPDIPRQLILVHPDDTTMPSGTAAWLTGRDVVAHHHVRLGVGSDLDRLARRIAGRAVGLALSGGGARGYVHIGLLKALEERGVPVDVMFGTSMGAVVGSGYAITGSAEGMERLASRFADRKQLIDHTLPLVALTRSRKVSDTLKAMCGADTMIEDLWIPFACVSASLTNAEVRLHDRGPLWRAVRASAAIPGVFTPLLDEDGSDVLVDGGVMNNFPVDLLREYLGPGTVIASNAYGGKAEGKPLRFGDDVSGWAVLRSKLLPFGRRVKAPSLLGTLMRATSLASKSLMEEAERYADLVVTYPTTEVTSLEFDRYPEMIENGHVHGGVALDAWLAKA